MNFRKWLLEEYQDDDDDPEMAKAYHYFSIGHGDDDEPFQVWAIIQGVKSCLAK